MNTFLPAWPPFRTMADGATRSALLAVLLSTLSQAASAGGTAPLPWEVWTHTAISNPAFMEVTECNTGTSDPRCTGLTATETPPSIVRLGNAPQLAQTLGTSPATAFASANLATGELKVRGHAPNYQQAVAEARFLETILLDIPGLDAGETATIGLQLGVDGGFIDGSQANFSFQATSFGPPTGTVDQLGVQALYRGSFTGSSSETTGKDLVALADADVDTGTPLGDWLTLSATAFVGEITISGDDPRLQLAMLLTANGGAFDLAQTATIRLSLPDGAVFTSGSGVFLSEVAQASVTEPVTWVLLILGLAGAGAAGRRRGKHYPGWRFSLCRTTQNSGAS